MYGVIFSERPDGQVYGYVSSSKRLINKMIKAFDETYSEGYWRTLDDEGRFYESKNERSIYELSYLPSQLTPLWR